VFTKNRKRDYMDKWFMIGLGSMKKGGVILAIVACMCAPLTAQALNIAEGKTVTLVGEFGLGGWGNGILAPASTVTDGIFLGTSHQWDQNTVWWDERIRQSVGNSLIIDLGGAYEINKFTVQADDNDTYRLQYLNMGTLEWWDIPAVGGVGMQIRSIDLSVPITTTMLRFSATGGDQWYSVSEIQAEGRAVPDGGLTLAFLGAAMTGLLALRRRA
jgi:hypothetical protein